jgi:hypothetical protein
MKAKTRERKCKMRAVRTMEEMGADAAACAWGSLEWEEARTEADGGAEAGTKVKKIGRRWRMW